MAGPACETRPKAGGATSGECRIRLIIYHPLHALRGQDDGGEALVRSLAANGVRQVFGIPGVQLDHAADALYHARDDIAFICARNEQAVSYMADGYARSTGRVGVSMVVPGPGMLNGLAGLATAYACSSPLLYLVGQVDSAAIGRGLGALHEIPGQSAILRTLTKWSGLALRPEEIPGLVHRAFAELRSGRPRRPGWRSRRTCWPRAPTWTFPGRPGTPRRFPTPGCWNGPPRC